MSILTRETLYDLVWSTPLKTLAARFDVSDAGLAKICNRLDVPRPPQGHWTRLLHGHGVQQPPLPPRRDGVPERVELSATEKPPTEKASVVRREKPTIMVRDTLTGSHPAVRQLAALLKDDGRQRDAMRIVAYRDQATFRASSGQQQRALRILDALSRWMEDQGYRVALTQVPNDKWRYALVVASNEDSFRVSMLERQRQVRHEKTQEEKAKELRYGSSWAPKYDHEPAGELGLEFLDLRYSSSCGHWDERKATLESQLGNIALGVGDAFRKLAAERARRAEEARLQQVEAQRRAREREWVQHDERLKADLDEMVTRWEQARRISAFLDAAAPAIIAACSEDRAFALAWLVWARKHASAMDPVARPWTIPKHLSPDSACAAQSQNEPS